jgi:two-component system, cell cycle sensor histidine kinase and response regulator CckA
MALAQRPRTAICPPSVIARRDSAREAPSRQPVENDPARAAAAPSLRTLAGGIAHNFNNLLTVIIGNACLMRGQLAPDSPMLAMVDQIESAAHDAEDITQQMMHYAQRSVLRLEVLNISNLVLDLDARFKACVDDNICVEYDLSPTLPNIRGDWLQLRRLISNLFFNAVEAIGDKPGVIRLRTQVNFADRAFLALHCPQQTLPEGLYVWLQVSDTGCGMDEQTKKHIFEPFFTTKFIGRGLGLSAGWGIVRQHQGTIWVADRPVRGTNVNILLPCVSVA